MQLVFATHTTSCFAFFSPQRAGKFHHVSCGLTAATAGNPLVCGYELLAVGSGQSCI